MSEQPREGTRVHDLKTLPGFIDAIEESGKSFEVRNNDRRFKTGDTLRLREYEPDEGYSGREIHRRVGYVLDGFPGIEKGYCVMALEPAQPEQPREEGDDLAARLEARADNADKMAAEVARNPSNYGESGPRHHARLLAAAYAFRKAAEMARASTHPEQSARVDLRVATYHNALYDIATDTEQPGSRKASRLQEIARKTLAISFADRPTQPQPRGEEARVADPTPCDRCGNPIGIVWFADNSLFNEITGTVGVGMLCPTCFDHLAAPRLLTWKAAPVGEQELPAPPRGEGDDLAARTVQIIRNRAKIAREQGTTEAQIIRARALDEAANEFADILPALRASTHPEQWVSGDDREWLLWITSYVLNRHEFTDSAATDARAALTRIATAIKQPPTPTEQGEDRTRVEWHDGIEHGDELALRQLAADIGCGIPYGCQPSVGKWYAAALDRVLDRLLPLDPAPEQGEGEAS